MYTLEQIIKTWKEVYGEDMAEEYAGFLDALQGRGHADDKTIQYYSRKCDVCNKGMESGFVLDSGGEYACSEKCLDNMPDYSHEQFLIDYAESEAGDFDSCYWTEWEQYWEHEDSLFLEDGTEVSNPFPYSKEKRKYIIDEKFRGSK